MNSRGTKFKIVQFTFIDIKKSMPPFHATEDLSSFTKFENRRLRKMGAFYFYS